MSSKRRDIVVKVFNSIDTDRDGVVSMTDIGSCFNPKNHPEVKAGIMTVQTLLNAFFETFSVVSKNGFVTLEQFLEYYANASFYEDDDAFEKSMSVLWTPHTQDVSRNAPTSLETLARNRGLSLNSNARAEASPNSALEQLQEQLKNRGARGIVGLSRKFRILDDDNTKTLSMSEFKKGIKECSLQLTDLQLNELFSFFDKDRSGTVDYEEFLQGVRVSICNVHNR